MIWWLSCFAAVDHVLTDTRRECQRLASVESQPAFPRLCSYRLRSADKVFPLDYFYEVAQYEYQFKSMDYAWKILEVLKLEGADIRIAVAFLVIAVLIVLWIGKTTKERKPFLRQITYGCMLMVICILVIAIRRSYSSRSLTFSGDDSGILVLNITGDKEGALKRDLVSTLNNELAKESSAVKIKVRVVNEQVEESTGRQEAHAQAREIGRKYHAHVVFWGATAGEKKFFPRITLVNHTWTPWLNQDVHIEVQDINGLNLPPVLVAESVSLAHFAAGYDRYARGQYQEALNYFESALINKSLFKPLEPDFLFFAGMCDWRLCRDAKELSAHQQKAIDRLRAAISQYGEQGLVAYWARANAVLGSVYLTSSGGNTMESFKEAIKAYESALSVLGETNSPETWAAIQQNLSVGYAGLMGGRPRDLERAISAAESALRVFTHPAHSNEWALVQLALCEEYAMLPPGKEGSNLKKSIAAGELALQVLSEKRSSNGWAEVQAHLCTGYRYLGAGDLMENASKSVTAGEAALRVFTERATPQAWAGMEACLCWGYLTLAGDQVIEKLKKSVNAGEAALRVITERGNPSIWAEIQFHLGNAYQHLGLTAQGVKEREEDYRKSIPAFESALRYSTGGTDPMTAARIQGALCSEYASLSSGDLSENLQKAIGLGEAALGSFADRENRKEWSMIQNNLSVAYRKLLPDNIENVTRSIQHFANVFSACSAEDYGTPYYNDASNVVRMALAPEPDPPFERPRIEVFSITDSNRMTALQNGDIITVLFRLKAAAIQTSVQSRLLQWKAGRLLPLSHWLVIKNIAITRTKGVTDFAGAVFLLRYETDTRETNLVNNLQIRGNTVFLDDVPVSLVDLDIQR